MSKSVRITTRKVRDLSRGAGFATLIHDPRLRWPDNFSEGPDGALNVTTSHIQDSAFYKKSAPIALVTELGSVKPTSSR